MTPLGVLIGLGVAGGTIGITSAVRKQQFAKDVASANSEAALKRGAVESESIRRDAKRRIASTRAAFGASGGGTPESIISDQLLESEMRAVTAERTGQIIARDEDLTRRNAQANQSLAVAGFGINAGANVAKGAISRSFLSQ